MNNRFFNSTVAKRSMRIGGIVGTLSLIPALLLGGLPGVVLAVYLGIAAAMVAMLVTVVYRFGRVRRSAPERWGVWMGAAPGILLLSTLGVLESAFYGGHPAGFFFLAVIVVVFVIPGAAVGLGLGVLIGHVHRLLRPPGG